MDGNKEKADVQWSIEKNHETFHIYSIYGLKSSFYSMTDWYRVSSHKYRVVYHEKTEG